MIDSLLSDSDVVRLINVALLGIAVLTIIYSVGTGIQKRLEFSRYLTVRGKAKKLRGHEQSIRAPGYVLYTWNGETYAFSDPKYYVYRNNSKARVSIDIRNTGKVYTNTWSTNGTFHIIASVSLLILASLLLVLLVVSP